MYVQKRDKRIVEFNQNKIVDAVLAAFNEVDKEITDYAYIKAGNIADYVLDYTKQADHVLNVEEIQDLIEKGLMATKRKDVAKAFMIYRYQHELERKNKVVLDTMEILSGDSDYWKTENSNKNLDLITTKKDYVAGAQLTNLARTKIFPKEAVKAHDAGIIHIHDADYSPLPITNCCLINLNDMLQNGTVINNILIEKPHRLLTATTIATQIIAAVASSQYGGATISLTPLAPFVRDSYNYYLKEAEKEVNFILEQTSDDWGIQYKATIEKIAKKRLKKEIEDAVQTLQYQINSFTTANNGMTPFVSINMYLGETDEYKDELAMLIEEVLKQRIAGIKNEDGVPITIAFPKLLYFLEEDNIHEDSKYWYLTQLAAECTAKRMVPDYISEKIMRELKLGDAFPCMGCRSFLGGDKTRNGWNNKSKAKDWTPIPKYYGRANIGVVTLNLVDVALSAKQELVNDKKEIILENILPIFWRLMDERTELCRTVNLTRLKRLEHVQAKVAPILWCNGALARLEPEEEIGQLLHDGYTTSSLGFCGLQEAVKVLTNGHSPFEKEGHQLGLDILQFMNDKCDVWNREENIGWSIYGTPLESTTYKFAKTLRKRFGEIKDITDKNYVTNSYHHWVKDKIDIFTKFSDESEFQKLSGGGAICYGETTNLQNNIEAILPVLKHIYNTTMYAELNTKLDYDRACGFEGEILLKFDEKTQKHYYECPNCGNRDTNKMNIARRVCGYISTTVPNEGRLSDIADRYIHLDDHEA